MKSLLSLFKSKPLREMSEKELLKKMRRGNSKAFYALYDRNWKDVFAYVYNYTHKKKKSEKIVKEAFLTVWRERKRIKVRHSLFDNLIRISGAMISKRKVHQN